jgi:hypothetical protein
VIKRPRSSDDVLLLTTRLTKEACVAGDIQEATCIEAAGIDGVRTPLWRWCGSERLVHAAPTMDGHLVRRQT